MKKRKFRIGSSADTANELKKTLELQLLYIHGLFYSSPKDLGQAIHEARRSYKKCRAILRLMRDAMGYASYYRENLMLRDMQRELSELRDADVQYHLLSRLAESYPKAGKKARMFHMTKKAKMDYHLEIKRFTKAGKAAVIARYSHAKAAQIQDYELSGTGFEMIEGGLSRMYRQGREMGNMVLTMETDASEIHAFRKKAKYLQNQLFYLRTISRPFIKPMSSTLEKLTDHLGDYNDLYMASRRIEEFATENDLPPKKREAILHKLREEMQKALNQAIQAYKLIYVEKPKHFIHRISQYWQAYYED